jgi:hypothetical protein
MKGFLKYFVGRSWHIQLFLIGAAITLLVIVKDPYEELVACGILFVFNLGIVLRNIWEYNDLNP